MAVSSSVGSNIFDITVGLPLPWLCHTIFIGPVTVGSESLLISVIILFVMLVLVVATIVVSKWRMTKYLGYAMFAFYGIFVVQNLLFQFDVIRI